MHQISPIGVAIVSYNTLALLRECLASLRGCSLPLRICVVDNGSTDGSPAMVRAEFPEVELLLPGRNLGFAAGNNLAIQALLPLPYLLLLNPDTVVHPGAIEALAAFLEAHPRVGVVGPRLLNPDGTLQRAAFRFPTLSMTTLDLFPPGEALPGRLYDSWAHGRYPQERDDTPFAIDHPLGACMLVRAAAVAQVGLLDAGYFMYSEEVEWCWRIRRAGWAIWQQPAARVTHVGGAATRQFRRQMQVALYRSRLRFFRQNYSAPQAAAHRAIISMGMLRASLLAWRAYARGQSSRDELRARLLAYGEIAQL
jgi:N-acetylglucosaminyl-diphospho-decaprenol L-rhamnosyltransferase